MKKLFIICMIFSLSACSAKQTMQSSAEETKELTTPISKADFSESDVENVFNMAVRNHCRLLNQVCTVQKTVQQKDTIYGTYTYEENEQTYMVTGILENVQVSKNDASIVTIGKKLFYMGEVEQPKQAESAEEDTDTTNTELPHFDLPTEVDESKNGEVVYEDETYKIRLMHIASGSMNFSGSFDGTGSFAMYSMSLDQTQVNQFVSLEGSGSYDESIQVDEGWYYIVIVRQDGTFTMRWNG